MKPAIVLFSLALSFTVAAANEKLDNLVSKIARREIDAGRVIGMTVGVAQGDEIMLLKGYGISDLENGIEASGSGVYRIGSITKMFTAAGIMLLLEDGSVSLEDPLSKYIPEYPKPTGDKVTIKHLLNHTSGIYSFTDRPDRIQTMRTDLTSDEVLAQFQDEPVHFEPGESFRYCNSGYVLLGLILEAASEQKFGQFLNERIFEPLKLVATYLDSNVKIIPNRVRGYSKWGESIVNANYTSMTQPFAAGAMASTAGDLIKWQRALVNDQLLDPKSYQLMTTRGEQNDGKSIPYGFGCFVSPANGKKPAQIWHGGGIPGFISELVYFPESDLTVVVLTNAMTSQANRMSREIARGFINLNRG